MLDLYRLETELQVEALTAGLLALERDSAASDHLEACMRAAHSLKGAAHIVGLSAAVAVAHALEDCFVAAQRSEVTLARMHFDLLLSGVDLLKRIAETAEESVTEAPEEERRDVAAFLAELAMTQGRHHDPAELSPTILASGEAAIARDAPAAIEAVMRRNRDAGASPERAIRVSPQRLNRLVGLAAESLAESRWVKPFSESLLRLKRRQYDAARAFEDARKMLTVATVDDRTFAALDNVHECILEIQASLADRLVELENYDRRSTNLAHRLYDDALGCRMRPFADGVAGLPRMVRDLGRALGKEVRLEVVGEATLLDRDMLERLEAPLGHLLRNAIDHGIEPPGERLSAGKAAEGVVVLEAIHAAGMLQVTVSDDGRGVDIAVLRDTVAILGLMSAQSAAALPDAEVLEFLFVPRLSMKDAVTEISGRGVGLDVVKDMVTRVGGTIRFSKPPGGGAQFQLLLPLSLSVVRTLLVDVGGESYAFPLAQIVRTLKVGPEQVESLEGRRLFTFDGRPIGLVSARQLLHDGALAFPGGELATIVVGAGANTYGIVVDRFLGERELVVHAFDARLGKMQDIAAGALMEDGSPVLIVDIADLIDSLEGLGAANSLDLSQARDDEAAARKRVLVVDDSLTVRELERKLLENAGYDIEVAVNGADGWNAVRSTRVDLVITDVDMPRLDGIELVTLIKRDPLLRAVPVIVISYKDREEDKRRGLEAGADYFLSKGAFHDETFLKAVVDLIGVGAA